MRTAHALGSICLLIAMLALFPSSGAAQTSQTTQKITASGQTFVQPTPQGSDVFFAGPEFSFALMGDGSEDSGDSGGAVINRSLPGAPGVGATAPSGKRAKSNPVQKLTFTGLNHRQQRLANNGNQFSVEPPDQGLCVGNGFVMEVVNDVLNVFDATGHSLLASPEDLNTFYGYPAAIVRSTGTFGPEVTDPSCYFDVDTQRWFVTVLTLDVIPTGKFAGFLTGGNHLDLAVSATSSPLGGFTIYRIPAEDDGTQGQPNHNCPFCFGDYPHLGADANGFYITTNEFSLTTGPFHGSQIYALSKQALAANSPVVTLTHIDTADASLRLDGHPGHTVWPATSPGGNYATDGGGTEYFLSSVAVFSSTSSDTRLRLWTLSNTQSLNTATPAITLNAAVVPVNLYARPPKSVQKVGDVPLVDCLNDSPCAIFLNGVADPFTEAEYKLDSNDSRMQQVIYANGKLWGSLDTALTVDGVNQASVAWFILNPSAVKVDKQGYIGLPDTNLIYPAVGVTPSGRGVIAFTLVGTNDYPSAAYASLDALAGAGPVTIVDGGAGPGPADGFSGTFFYNAPNPPRPRWGDYGATATDGNSIWIASEFIAQTCSFATYVTAPFGSCGGTRSSLANWATRITLLTP
jgi:hypothetical protein